MLIKESDKQGRFVSKIKGLAYYRVGVPLLILLFYSGAMILLGGNLHKEGFFGEVLKPLIQENINIPVNYVKGLMSRPEKLTIDIKHKDYQKLAYKRKIAVEEGVLHPYKDDFVSAKIRWNGETIKVKMRLKGDLGDHWSRDYKWSFRVKSKQEKTIMGMSNFSLQHPRTRGFLNDWYLHKILNKLGFITLRYDFVDVTVNGKHLGIYALEEHFTKQLIENNKHINAPIVRIKDHLLWYLVDPKTGFEKDQLDELYSASPIDAFNTGSVNDGDTLFENFKKAKNLLEAFRRGELVTNQVFDVDKTAKVFAVIDLFGYRHSTAYSNIRFYYNPITSLLVPLGYDNTFIKEADSIEGQGKRIKLNGSEVPEKLDWRDTFFEDEVFFRKYMEALAEVSDKKFLDELFDHVQEEYKEKLGVIYSNFPGYSFSSQKAELYKNQTFIKNILNPLEGIQAYFKGIDRDKGILMLQIGNIQLLPVEIGDVYYGKYRLNLVTNSIPLQSKTRFQPVDFKELQFKLPEGLPIAEDFGANLRVGYKIFGTDNEKEIAVFNWTYYDDDFLKTDFIRQGPNYQDFDFISVDEGSKSITFSQGVWTINKNIIIPEGYKVFCAGGTQLDLTNSAKILSYSPIEFIGSENNRIIIGSSDFTGQGIVVLNANKKSIISNVIFKNLSPASQSGWRVPGAVTFYESQVDIQKSSFIGNKSGVALSIIRSEFNISDSFFIDVSSDALSVIFGKGIITNTTVTDGKRDGMHFSGSYVEAKNIFIKGVENAAVSAGENSNVHMNNVEIGEAGVAVESKDSSKIIMENVAIFDSSMAFYVTRTKHEFGPAMISANTVATKNVKEKSVIQGDSLLLINGKKEQE